MKEKGPACRQSDETYDECVSRKISELIEIDGMEQDQAVAAAQNMCGTACSAKEADVETKAPTVSESVKKSLAEKAKVHNEKHTAASKRTSTRTLIAVFRRGVGAYNTNPQSVRPSVSSADQWAYARVNSFLYALRNGRFRSGKHDTDLLPKGHPQSTKSLDYDEKAPKTNFPKRGDDLKVSLRNSQYDSFPLAYALKLREEHPDIWRKGGNILGNTQFNRLRKVHSQMGEAKTPTDEKAVRLREAWAARHLKDHRLAGVVAQIKWLVIGSRGLSHMKQVIDEARKKSLEE